MSRQKVSDTWCPMKKNCTYIKTFRDLVEFCGGSLNMAVNLKVVPKTIERWELNGIPTERWEHLHDIFGVTPFECFIVNSKILKYTANVKKIWETIRP